MREYRKVVLYIASSLDGYIAAKDESLEWLFKVEGEGDNGYSNFYDTVDTVLMGKKTFDWVMQNIEEFPYKNKECYVFTRSSIEDTDDVKFINGNIKDFVNNLRRKKGENIWLVGGGELLHSFIQDDLIDECIITIAPALIGVGIPLFKQDKYQIDLSLKNTRRYGQFVELHYVVKREYT